ncbi:hypothetical protein [Leuconostoc pseudomesenteroides]|uniref:hypothetical protein n=1 Tax=Leuconostoc pseudomesenteroides TaxID=33968 RepID=UPI00112041D0|nr:hypothetical protein [Leuconostoc pseudomesenteroides]TOZ02807.1 hypothetical protein DIS14_09605 [Leuconostoc pseudomesenteroides]
MKNKVIYLMTGLLAVGVLLVMSYNGQQRVKIAKVENNIKKFDKQQATTTKATKKLETNYNQADEKAKSTLIDFAKKYYTFSSQADYDKRFGKLSDDVALADEQKQTLFSDGRDVTGGSKIDNLGLQSEYETAVGYTSDKQDNLIETLATVVIKVSSDTTKTIRQAVLIHGWYDTNLDKFVSITINDLQ